MKLDYTTHLSTLKLSQQMRDLVWRRTLPFLDRAGTAKSLQHLLAEAYLQGIKDTIAALDTEEEK